MSDLDVRLARERAELLDATAPPPLARLRERAAARSRRRRATRGAAVVGVALAAALLVHPFTDAGPAPSPIAETPPAAPVYTAAGVTIHGLTGAAVADVEGTIIDVEFTDPDHGYLLSTCPADQPCPASVAWTADGGRTWQHRQLPTETSGQTDLNLLAFPDGHLVLAGGTLASDDAGRTWRPTTAADIPTPIPAHPGDLLLLGPYPEPGRCGGPVEVWQPGFLRAGTPLRQPDIQPCWVAPAPATDGAWWAGGARDGAAAVAVTRDRGATWQAVPLEVPAPAGGSVEVATLGNRAYAAVLGPDRTINALLRSVDGGRTFTRTRDGSADAPRTLAGAMVPLPDGRLLVAGGDRHWYTSADDGATFTRAEGNLPSVGRLDRTSAGYLAYDLFGGGWAAFSADGATWRKLQIN